MTKLNAKQYEPHAIPENESRILRRSIPKHLQFLNASLFFRDMLMNEQKTDAHDYNGKKAVMFSEPTSVYRIEQSRAFIERHFNQRIKVPALAAKANLSTSHFYKLFKRDTGCAPLAYLNRLKIERACVLLATTVWSVKLIATNLGYDDPLYFSKVFKSFIGVAPKIYRRLKKTHYKQNILGNILPSSKKRIADFKFEARDARARQP